jgi:hypothetical protein
MGHAIAQWYRRYFRIALNVRFLQGDVPPQVGPSDAVEKPVECG